jgi:putative membrane protein
MDMTGWLTLASAWHDWHDGSPGWWTVFVPLFWIVLIGTAIVLLRGRRSARVPRESPIERLERRYADGEVSLEDYRERRAVLSEEQ